MNNWKPHQYRITGESLGVSQDVLDASILTANIIHSVHSDLPAIFSLNHLSKLSGVEYGLLRSLVNRKSNTPYRFFKIRKKTKKLDIKNYRLISVPSPELNKVQSWVCQNVLNVASSYTHSASTAFAPGSNIVKAAEIHCGAKWLIKIDIQNFFESISEYSAYEVFHNLGYQPLVSFEMARLCTKLFGPRTYYRKHYRWRNKYFYKYIISDYWKTHLGHLPQGAPTSPMLANLAMISPDKELHELAGTYGLSYSRYADDLTFSTGSISFNRDLAKQFIGKVYKILGKYGFMPNVTKTKIASPRARKIVLGLLVNGSEPRLTRDFKMKIRMHLYFLNHKAIGPARHARNRGFSAVTGFKNHIYGLAYYAYQVEKRYGAELLKQLNMISWPI